jgi:hypothetical protein
LGAYHDSIAKTIAHFDGFVARYMGDGVLVYFGYPRAHEDDAERAVRAGLAQIEAVGQLYNLYGGGGFMAMATAAKRTVLCDKRSDALPEGLTLVPGPPWFLARLTHVTRQSCDRREYHDRFGRLAKQINTGTSALGHER